MDSQCNLLGDAPGRELLKSRGISLIEVMVALSLAALLIVLGLPSFSSMIAGMRVRTSAEDLSGAIQLARSEAVKSGVPVVFSIESDYGDWSIYKEKDPSVTLRSGVAVNESSLVSSDSGTTMTFDSIGLRRLPEGGDMLIEVKSTSGDCQPAGPVRCLSILVRPGGMIRLCDPQRPSGDPQSCTISD